MSAGQKPLSWWSVAAILVTVALVLDLGIGLLGTALGFSDSWGVGSIGAALGVLAAALIVRRRNVVATAR